MSVTDLSTADLLAVYREGANDLASAVAGLDEAALDARPGPDDWTVREIVWHMADNELIASVRLRCLLTQDAPDLVGYDEALYATAFDYAGRPLTHALALLQAGRVANVEVLERLAPEQWTRSGTHPESGHHTVRNLVESNIRHMNAHIEQVQGNVAATA